MSNILDPFCHATPEPLALRQEAGRAGWRVDEDGFFWRHVRLSDPIMAGGAEPAGFIVDDKVYMPDCAHALRYDAGEWRLLAGEPALVEKGAP